ncbi:MAG: hypothetical protein ACYDHF_06970 [Candidatus Cryosericum sp.]
MRREAAARASVLFTLGKLLDADAEDVALEASLIARRPETVQAILSATDADIQRELDFIDKYVRGDPAAQRAYGALVEQLERPGGCEAVLVKMGSLSAEDRALLLDHYLVIAHRLAQGFRDRVRKCSN